MAKILVTDSSGDSSVPFLRGILTSSLSEAGLPFGQAFEGASEVRRKLGDSSKTITKKELRAHVREYLRKNFDAKIVDSYDAGAELASGFLVRTPAGDLQPLSWTEHMRHLAPSGLGEEQAREAISLIFDKLGAEQRRVISSEELLDVTEECLSKRFGPRAAERYRIWMNFSHSGRPLILLIGGITGSGKSTIATELAHQLGIVRTQSTDMLREVMRRLLPDRLLPVLHRSSFDAWNAMSANAEHARDQVDLLVEGYLRQAELLTVPCEAVIQRALRERVSLILEGVHVHPTLLESIGENSDAVVVVVMLCVLKREELRSRLSGRIREAPKRDGETHLSNYERIWRLQAFLLSEADRAGIPILINEDKDKATDLVLQTIVDALVSEGGLVK